MKYIELNTFLKCNGLVSTGGQAKHIIRESKIKVNGVVETRNKRKLVAGDKIVIDNKEFVVEEKICLKKSDF